MIEVYADKQQGRWRVYLTGHAEACPRGRTVCAAVSALSGALLQFVTEQGSCIHLRRHMAPGSVFLSCRCPSDDVFLMTVSALKAISEAYPQDVKYCTEPLTTGGKPPAIIKERATALSPSDTAKE